MALPPLSVVLELTRAADAGDPYAFSFKPQAYLLRSEGGGYESIHIEWDQGMLAALASVHHEPGHSAAVQGLGERLRRFLQPAGWSYYEQEILKAVQNGRQVMLTLRFAAAELYVLPWELVTIKSTGQHLGELPGVLCRYEWPETKTAPARSSVLPDGGRILLAWSAAGGAVPAAEHQHAIAAACQAAHLPFDLNGDVLPNASCRRLSEALQAAQRGGTPISTVHLLCHGGKDGDGFGLVLDKEDAESGVVGAGTLRQVLAPYADMVRLVVLCACDSGNSGALGNQVGSVAQALHRTGFAQVVASRYPMSVLSSIKLTETLYQALNASNGALERALISARQQLIAVGAQRDWASIQLYARAADLREAPVGTVATQRGKRQRLLIGLVAASIFSGALLAGLWGSLRPKQTATEPAALRQDLNKVFIAAGEPLVPTLCQAHDAEALKLLCRSAALLQTDPPAALTLLEKAEPSIKESAEYWALLAKVRLAASQPTDAALAAAQSALGQCPNYALAYNLVGNAEQKAGNLDAATAAYGKALAAAPDYHAPRLNMSIVALRRNDTASAIATLDDLIRRDPDNPRALLLRGQAHLLAGQLPQALSDLEQTTRRQAGNATAWLLLGTAHSKSGHKDAANDAFCRAKTLGSTEASGKCPN